MKIKNFIPKKQFRYFFTQLNSKDKNIYTTLLDGFLAHSNKFECQGPHERIIEIFYMLKYDIPELFYVETINVSFSASSTVCTILPTYLFGVKATLQLLQALHNKYASFIHATTKLKAIDKEKAIHDLLASRVKFDHKKSAAAYNHTITGPLLYNIGVCEGIAKSFKYLADRVGLKSIFVIGSAKPYKKENDHAWNLVQINNIYYHLDVTHDITMARGRIRYDYFNLSDSEIRVNHSWKKTIPKCRVSYNYYRRIGLYFDSKSQLAAYIQKSSKQNVDMIFQVSSLGGKKADTFKTVKEIVHKNILFNPPVPINYYITHNPDLMVFQVYTNR